MLMKFARTDYNGVLPRRAQASQQTLPAQPPSVSTDALRVGLAHLLHEINNPIQSMILTVNFLENDTPKVNGYGHSYQYKLLGQLKDRLDELVAVVGSLQSELENLWQIDPIIEPLQLAPLIDELLQCHKLGFDKVGLSVVKRFTSRLAPIRGNERLLRQVFTQLLRNAAEAMPAGGVLTIRAHAAAGAVSLEISDTGVGMPPGIDPFQPFITSKPKGMGLGLAIARHIVETHGGTISYQSVPSKGTTFLLSFPLLQK